MGCMGFRIISNHPSGIPTQGGLTGCRCAMHGSKVLGLGFRICGLGFGV